MHFLRASVNARDVDFSDTIATKRKSYRTRTLRTRRRIGRDGEIEEVVVGDSDEDEDPEESFARKLARLRREAEDLKQELEERRKKQQEGSQEGRKEEVEEDESLEELSRTLDALRASAKGAGATTSYSAESALKKKLASEDGKTDAAEKREKREPSAAKSTPSSETSGLLAHAASFDERLSLIEAAMGISTSSNPFVPSADGEPPLRPILPTLEQLTSQLAALSSALGEPAPVSAVTTSGAITTSTAPTTSNIETLTSRIKKLTSDADALAAARNRAAAAAAEARRQQDAAAEADPTITSPRPGSSSSAQQQQQALQQQRDEQTSKIQALYATLPTIQSLHPLLPSVLERLRSLRALHAGAAQASETLDALEKDQAEMSKEIEAWREGLRVVESKTKENEEAMKKNLDVVGPWVRELEERLKRLEQQS